MKKKSDKTHNFIVAIKATNLKTKSLITFFKLRYRAKIYMLEKPLKIGFKNKRHKLIIVKKNHIFPTPFCFIQTFLAPF